MTIVFSSILILFTIAGAFSIRYGYKSRDIAVNDALNSICGSGMVTMLLCAMLTITKTQSLGQILYSLYYISYAATIFTFSRFTYIYTRNRDSALLKSPFFYASAVAILLILINFRLNNCFTYATVRFAGDVFPISERYELFNLYIALLGAEVFVATGYVIFGIIKSAKLYRSRYFLILAVIAVHLLVEVLSYRYTWPCAVKTLFLLPEGLLLIYICGYYSTKKLTMSVINSATDNQVNGLMIYDENGFLIYHNKKIDDLFSPEQIESFHIIDRFDKWANDLDEFNGIYIKTIEINGKRGYYNIYKHTIGNDSAIIGTSYSFQDSTDSIERFVTIEEANEELKRAANMKTDFLANMSHEIRTPMNAVIGLAEMALREEMTDQARDYLSQIKSSGRNLLNIINDILDFSKIEAGKMDIIPEVYEPLSEFNDVANTLMTRIGEKDIELTVEENPSIPVKLEGDVLRIRQILINLANNAIKFTFHGRVQIIVDYTRTSDEELMLSFHVVDTGVGIKKEDLKKLFTSFQQVDTKRNRSVEGTGLGLAISKSLVETMGGTIGVESEYGKGSDFYFKIPQKIIDPNPSVTVGQPENIFAFGLFHKKYLARRFFIDTSKMGVFNVCLRFGEDYDNTCDLYSDLIGNRRRYLFFEERDYKDQVRDLLLKDRELIGVMLAEFTSTFRPDLQNLRMIRKPFSTVAIAMAFNNLELHLNNEEGMAFVSDFTAPDARILIVDDNMVNLTVAEGLLEPLKMNIECAASGKEAIDKLNTGKFDIIFMDHMMPEMDGVETTHIIRRMYPELKDTPIIALTANAVSGVKEYFIKEGMNDFVPKPIEVRDIMSKVKQWLPDEKVIKTREIVSIKEEAVETAPQIEGLDTATAVNMIGSVKLYDKILKEYYRNIHSNYDQIQGAYDSADWENYTIKVHSLKSSSRQIGALTLSEKAARLEEAGKSGDIDYIRTNNAEVLDEYLALVDRLACYCADEDDRSAGSVPIDPETLKGLLDRTITAGEDLDMDEMEKIVEEFRKYTYDESIADDINSLIESAEIMDVFTSGEIAAKLLERQ